MSWDAYFYTIDIDGERHALGEWNYTHNTNKMINDVLGQQRLTDTPVPWWERIAKSKPSVVGSWWNLLDGCMGSDGHALLSAILTGLDADPERFRAMNPSNGWGDYDQLRDILREMAELSRKFPTGVWSVNG